MTADNSMTPSVLADLQGRMVKAQRDLEALADGRKEMDNYYFRLLGKAQGVELALSYLDEVIRERI